MNDSKQAEYLDNLIIENTNSSHVLRDMVNVLLAQDHSALKSFAWIYQAGTYFGKGLLRKNAASKLKEEFASARERNALLDALGVKQTSKGLVVFKDGKYIKGQ